jgi:uncharacterized zinc-type alcohol dehydrogenase-like protein
MQKILAYAAQDATSPLTPFSYPQRELRKEDVAIQILFCGVCHSDLHQARNEWGGSRYPMVPGHEIVGIVTQVGSQVTHYQRGDKVGVGCMVDSCQQCASCEDHLEQYCEKGCVYTYNSLDSDGKSSTFGGYATGIVVKEKFVLRLPLNLPLENMAPLLCAGITTYSPMKKWGVGPHQRVGIVGIGGLGHMGIKMAKALGAEVVAFTSSAHKAEEARRLGADHVAITREAANLEPWNNKLDFVLDTVSAAHDVNPFLQLLKRDATMVLVGVPTEALSVQATSLISHRRQLVGSLIGGSKETQEMLDFCGRNGIVSEIETIAIQDINEAYERMLRQDVKYRFVIDMKSLQF